jgi:Fis family transcriptional regulator, factor for inversion stimulation protein
MNTQYTSSQGPAASLERRREPLSSSVKTALNLYLSTLNGHTPGPVYKMVMAEVERPMLEAVMEHVKGNQSRAARILGISRSCLRQKLKSHDPD